MKLYDELAGWWPLMSPPAEYVEEAAFYRAVLQRTAPRPPHALLELGSGGGHNASHLKAHYEMVLVDRSPGMLEVSRALNPECEHVLGDMRTVRLGRSFDGVFVHDAVCYLTAEADAFRLVMETAAVHCRPGGIALFAPDYVRETFRAGTAHGGSDAGVRGMRWVEWRWDPDPDDATYIVDYAYLLREADGSVRVAHDRHIEGLFPRDRWLGLLEEAGFRPAVVPFEQPDPDAETLEVFVGVKPE